MRIYFEYNKWKYPYNKERMCQILEKDGRVDMVLYPENNVRLYIDESEDLIVTRHIDSCYYDLRHKWYDDEEKEIPGQLMIDSFIASGAH